MDLTTLTAALLSLVKQLDLKYPPTGVFLHRCICGAPTFQQPCPHCSYYPQASESGKAWHKAYEARLRDTVSREQFVAAVTRAGGYGPFYLRGGYGRSCAYLDNVFFRSDVDRLVEQAKTMTWPDPGALYDYFAADPKAVL